MKFNLDYKLSDIKKVPPNGLKVFSVFSCGGGSSIGYKLAGFDVIGHCEIDSKIANIYNKNLNPKYSFVNSVRDLKNINLPKEIINSDILDGSPPCTPFSVLKKTKLRLSEKGVSKKFREGQSLQVLDSLIIDFVNLLDFLNPKIVIIENVGGILQEKGLISKLTERCRFYGYFLQVFKVNLKFLDVPQSRTRVFFLLKKKNKDIKINRTSRIIAAGDIFDRELDTGRMIKSERLLTRWKMCHRGSSFDFFKEGNHFNRKRLDKNEVFPIVTTQSSHTSHWDRPHYFSRNFFRKASTFPIDYDFCNKEVFILGMSVPPFGMYNISKQIYEQYF